VQFNPLTPNDPFRGRTAPLTSKRCVLYIYSTNIGTEYFKHGIYSPFFPLQNAVCFIILTYLVPVLFTFYIQGVRKLKTNSSGARLTVNRRSDLLDALEVTVHRCANFSSATYEWTRVFKIQGSKRTSLRIAPTRAESSRSII